MNRLSKPRRVLIQELLELQLQFDALKEASKRNIPDLTQAENQLNIQNQLFNPQLNFTDSNILSLDSHYNYIAFNDLHASEIKKLFSVDIKTGMNFLDCIPDPTLRKEAKQHIDRALAGEFYSQEINLPEYSLFYEINWIPISENKTVTGIILLARNITEQKLATEAVLKSEERYRTTLDNLLEGCHLLDFDLRYLYLNKAAEIQNRRPSGELIGNRYVDMWPGVEETRLFGMIRQALEERVANHFENEFRFPDGNKGWYDLSIQPVPEGILILSVDITQRKLSEDRLHKSVSSLKESNRIAQLGNFVFDITNGTWTSSEELDELYGIEPALERSLKDWSTIIHPDDRIMLEEFLANEVIGQNKKFDKEYRIIRQRNQEVRWMWGRGKLERDDSGRAIGLIGTSMDITERKQAEESLIKSKQLLSETESIGKVGGWEIDVNTMLTNWTNELYRIHEVDFDYNPNVANGIDFYPPDSRPIIEKAVQRAIEFGEPFDLELDIITAKGNPRKVHAIGKTDQEQRRVYGFFQDITEPKQLEKSSKISEDRIQNIFEQANDGIYIFSADNQYLNANEAGLQLLGYTKDELLQMNVSDVLHPDEISRLAVEPPKMMSGIPHLAEWIHLRKDGSTFPGEVSAKRLNDYSYLAIVRDLTNRKKAEEAIRDYNSKLQLAMQTANMAWWEMDIPTGMLTFDKRKAEMLGYQPENFKHYTDFTALIHPEDFDKAMNTMKHHLDGLTDKYEVEYRILASSGAYLWFYDIGAVVKRDLKGSPLNVIGFVIDVNWRKQIEERLHESLSALKELNRIAHLGNFAFDIVDGTWTSSDELDELYGIEPAFERSLEEWSTIIHPDDRIMLEEFLANEVISQDKKFDKEWRIIRQSDKAVRWIWGRAKLERDDSGHAKRLIGTSMDITERKQAEEAILRANRLYAVISQVNQAIVHIMDKDKLLDEICSIAINFGKFRMAWIGMLDEESQTVKPTVVKGLDDGYLSHIKQIILNDSAEGNGPTAKALREGTYFVCNDIENDPHMAPWKEEALKRGYRSSIALPIKQSGKVIASFNLYSSMLHFFSQEEIFLLEEVVGDISFAFDTIEVEKERERAVQEVSKFRTITDQANYGSAITSLDGVLIYVNQEFARMHQREPEELIGKSLSIFHNQEQLPRVEEAIELLKLYGKFSAEEIWRTRKDGSVFPSLMNASVIMDSNNIPLFLSATAIDITELKQQEEALQKSEENLNFAQEIANMGSWEFNLKTNAVRWSKNYYRLLDKDPTESPLSLEEIKKIVHPDDRELFELKIEEILVTRSMGTVYFRLIMPDGNLKWIQSNIVPRFVDDELIALRGISIDITEKKLAEQDLIRAKERAELSDRLKTAFLNNISHEIRTPLNSILGFGQILIDPDFSDEEKVDYYRMLNDSSERLLNTITNILDISMIVSGNLRIKKSEVSINELIRGVSEVFSLLCMKKNISISVQEIFQTNAIKLITDNNLVRKIFHQLIDNAVKFTSNGTITIGAEKNEGEIQFFVKDTGIGISDEGKSRIFGNFEQEDFANTRKFEGTGIGLSIAKGLVELLGGKIWLHSEKGNGSTFYFTIPIE
jgi:PAS domain S-box-containing protein